MRKILFLCVLIFWSFPAFGETPADGGFPACTDKRMYKMYMDTDYDWRRRMLLIDGCFLLPGGLKITVLKRSRFDALAKSRVFWDDETIVVWTHFKNVKKE